MHRAIARGGLLALLALTLTLSSVHAASSGATLMQQRATTVRSLVTALTRHQSPAAFFTAAPTLQVNKSQVRGARAVENWWRGQFRLGLRVSLLSSVAVRGDGAGAVLQWTTRSGPCAATCRQQATWRFTGARVASMTLTQVSRPAIPSPPKTVPAPPSAPPPRVTPTIPS